MERRKQCLRLSRRTTSQAVLVSHLGSGKSSPPLVRAYTYVYVYVASKPPEPRGVFAHIDYARNMLCREELEYKTVYGQSQLENYIIVLKNRVSHSQLLVHVPVCIRK